MNWLQLGPNGEKFDTSGPLRVETRRNDFFVVGLGSIQPVESIHDGNQLIRDLRNAMICKEKSHDRATSNSNDNRNPMDRILPFDGI